MADLLGSILGSMEKPPSLGDAERKKRKELKTKQEKLLAEQKRQLNKFREEVQKKIDSFIKDAAAEKYTFLNVDKTKRAIIHETSEVAGLTSFSFGLDEIDRYVILWKKEFAPSDDELSVLRKGEEWTPEKAKELERQRENDRLAALEPGKKSKETFVPNTNYKDKYEHLIGKESAKDAAKLTLANRSYGNVPSENKRDQRTIEQVMADNKAKRRKTEHRADETVADTSETEKT